MMQRNHNKINLSKTIANTKPKTKTKTNTRMGGLWKPLLLLDPVVAVAKGIDALVGDLVDHQASPARLRAERFYRSPCGGMGARDASCARQPREVSARQPERPRTSRCVAALTARFAGNLKSRGSGRRLCSALRAVGSVRDTRRP